MAPAGFRAPDMQRDGRGRGGWKGSIGSRRGHGRALAWDGVHRLLVTASALVVALAAAPAADASPGSRAQLIPTLYGGGAFGRYVQFVSVRLDPSGARADQFATLTTRCGRFRAPLFDNVRLTNLRVTNGRFSGLSKFSESVPAGIPEIGGLARTGTIGATSRLGTDGRASGIIRVRFTLLDPRSGAQRASCDTRSVRWSARIPTAGAGAGKPRARRGSSYRGLTAQGQPLLLRTARRRRAVDRAGMTFVVACESTQGRPLDLVAVRMRIRRGRFGTRRTFKRDYVSPRFGPVRETYSWRLRGRFGSRGVAGTWRVRGVVRRTADQLKVGDCDTGPNRWNAVR